MNVEQCTRKLVRLRKVASHIDGHLEQPLCLDELAEIASMSRYHFERVFADYAGETPLARVRRLRLMRARQLIESGRVGSMLNLALDSGYSSAEAFSRAFRACHGMTPSGVGSHIAAPAKIRIETLPAIAIQYLDFKGKLDDSITPFDQLRAHALLANIPRERRKGWCIQFAGDMGDSSREVELQIGLLSERLGKHVSGLRQGHLPAGHYALLRLTGGYSHASTQTLARRIGEETGWQVTDAPILRCFQNSSYLPAGFEKQCDLYVPVVR